MPDSIDFAFTTCGLGPVMLRALTTRAQDACESQWLEGPGAAAALCAALVSDGFSATVDGAPVTVDADGVVILAA